HNASQQTEHALDHREERLRQSILGHAADELRANGVADGEQEHQEHGRLQWLRNGDPDLSDHDRGQQGGRDRSQTDALKGELPEVVPEGEREKDRDLRVLAQRGKKPLNHLYKEGLSLFLELVVRISYARMRDGGLLRFSFRLRRSSSRCCRSFSPGG